MPDDVRLWEIADGDQLKAIQRDKLDLEERLEKWLEHDISILAGNLLVIGRQVQTGFGGTLDLSAVVNAES